MERLWPSRPHCLPVVFKTGNETIGLLKSIKPSFSNYYSQLVNKPTLWEIGNCFYFDCSFYFPHQIMTCVDEKVDNVLVMLNGLNEIYNNHYMHYDRIGAALAFRQFGVVLYPTPFHLNRTPYLKIDKRETYENRHDHQQTWPSAPGTPDMKRFPSASLTRDPTYLLHCFDQVHRELVDFAHVLKRDIPRENEIDKTFYDHFIHRNAKVSLLGYSMGGHQALYTFLSNPGLFDRCILINSGVSIQNINPVPVSISVEQWKKIVEGIRTNFDSVKQDIDNHPLLNEVLFGFIKKAKALTDVSSKILFISGGADNVTSPAYLPRPFSGLNKLEIASLGHPLSSPTFDRWFTLVANAIELFMKSPAKEGASAQVILDKLMEFKIQGISWDQHIISQYGAQEKTYLDDGLNLYMEKYVYQITDQKEEFMRLYIMSKRYWKDDAELLRAMERRRLELEAARPRPKTITMVGKEL